MPLPREARSSVQPGVNALSLLADIADSCLPAYVRSHGWSAFEARLDAAAPDLLDLRRAAAGEGDA